MKFVIFPGFLGYPTENHIVDLKNRLQNEGHLVLVAVSEELEAGKHMDYRISKTYSSILNQLEKTHDLTVIGFSLGSVMAIKLAADLKANRLVCVSGPVKFAHGDDMEPYVEGWKYAGIRQFISSKYGKIDIPFDFVEDAWQFDARKDISRVSCPTLFIAGKKDVRVPYQVTKELYNLAPARKKLKLFKGMGHDYKHYPELVRKVNDSIIDFCLSQLP